MCFKLFGFISMITDLLNSVYPNEGVKSSLFARISFR